jgi:hypothetical protein
MVCHAGYSHISIFVPDNNYLFSNYTLISTWIATHPTQGQMSSGDLNNDGKIDLVACFDYGTSILYNNSGTSITEFSNNQDNLTIYPNPAQNQITINLQGFQNLAGLNLEIYNIQGQLLIQQPLTQNNTQIDIFQFPQGIYLAKLRLNDGSIAQKKFIVIK